MFAILIALIMVASVSAKQTDPERDVILQGCFMFMANMPKAAGRNANTLTREVCRNACRGSKQYFGMRDGRECHCSDSLEGALRLPMTMCLVPCTGNPRQTCGGPMAIKVYARSGGQPTHSGTEVTQSDDFLTKFFTKQPVRMCLKPEFIQEIDNSEAETVERCAKACYDDGSPLCKGFRLMHDNLLCQLFMFDQCSHNLNTPNCNKTVQIWVRNQRHLLPGQLCPHDFGYKFGSSVYKLVKAKTWSAGKSTCWSQPGVSKFSDVNDREEATYIHLLKRHLSPSRPIFMGGYNKDMAGDWRWSACDAPIPAEVWQPDEPNAEIQVCCAQIWKDEAGIEDTHETGRFVLDSYSALCECVDPFFD